MRKMFIHAGPPKTGTTLIQTQLFAKSEALRAAGIAYISNEGIVERQRRRFYDYPTVGFDKLQAEFGASIDIELQRLKVGEAESAIVSWEAILGPPYFPVKSDIFPYAPIVISQIHQAVSKRGFEPHFIFHVRRQDEFLESWALQRVQAGNLLPFKEFVDGFVDIKKISWLRILDASVGVFGQDRTHALLFDDLSRGPQFYLDRFMSVIDPSVTVQYDMSLFSRLSFSAMAYEIALESFKSIRKRDHRRKFTRFLQDNCDSRTYGRCIFLDDEERAEMVEFYREENQRLFARFGLSEEVFDSHYASAGSGRGRVKVAATPPSRPPVTKVRREASRKRRAPYFSL